MNEGNLRLRTAINSLFLTSLATLQCRRDCVQVIEARANPTA
jgi:hypothetical protein